MFGDHPVELGWTKLGTALLDRLQRDATYRRLFAAAFDRTSKSFSIDNVVKSIASTCFRCHNGFLMGRGADFDERERDAEGGVEFHNTGLYNLAGALSYPPPNTGLYEIARRAEDVGKLKAPTLRNIAVTGPYLHDGSIETLDGVLDHYAAGGRTITEGPNRGVGHDNVNRSHSIRGFTLSPDQRTDFLAFLNSLTDEELLHDPRFANPWTRRQETR